jgi:hypothetical protein
VEYRVMLEVKDTLPFRIDVPGANGEEKHSACKATLWTSKWPKDDKCAPEVACPRCIAIRTVERDVIPERDGCEVKIDKVEPVISLKWATGGEEPKT